MICTFFGHKDTSDILRDKLKTAIEGLIVSHGVKMFYVGNNGAFDSLVQHTLDEIEKEYPEISFCVVLSYLGERTLPPVQDKTVFPEGQENALPRYAISKRNTWLINHSDFVICYVKHKFSNSYKWLEKAGKKGLTVINLADLN